MDSNFRFRVRCKRGLRRKSPLRLHAAVDHLRLPSVAISSGAKRNLGTEPLSRAEPEVRIHLPPAESPPTIGPAGLSARLGPLDAVSVLSGRDIAGTLKAPIASSLRFRLVRWESTSSRLIAQPALRRFANSGAGASWMWLARYSAAASILSNRSRLVPGAGSPDRYRGATCSSHARLYRAWSRPWALVDEG